MTELRNSATITVSSEYNASYSKDKAVDGNNGTWWASASEAGAAWIKFDWGTPVTVAQLDFICANDGWGVMAVEFSDLSVHQGTKQYAGFESSSIQFIAPKSTTYIKIYQILTTGRTNTGFAEMYISDVYTSTQDDTNLHKYGLLTASSIYNPSYIQYNARDTDVGTDWVSASEGGNAWLQYTWPQAVTISAIKLRDRASFGVWGTPKFVFDDATEENGSGAVSNSAFTTYTLSAPKVTTSVRIAIVSGSSGKTGLAETEIIGSLITASSQENIAGALMLAEITSADAANVSGIHTLVDYLPTSLYNISGILFLVEYTDAPTPTGIIDLTLNARSLALTLHDGRNTLTLNNRFTALTLKERP